MPLAGTFPVRLGGRPAQELGQHVLLPVTQPVVSESRSRRVRAVANSRSNGVGATAESPRWFAKHKLLPRRLLSSDPDASDVWRQQTVYTVRLSTGLGRGAGIDDPTAGVFIALVGKDGASYLHHITPLYDAETAEAELRRICQVADKEAGANCSAALSVAAGATRQNPPPKARFQPGSIDEVCFLGPELGPLAGLLAGPQAGAWLLEEAHISSSRTRRTDRFVCREVVGEGAEQQAAYLTPVPEGAVVYGSGSSSVILSKEQASALHAMGMLDYGALKGRLTVANAALVALGTATFAATGGWEAATPFLAGGCLGIIYQMLLQRSVDALPAGSAPAYPPAPTSRFMRAMSSGYARFTFVIVATLLSIHALDVEVVGPETALDPVHSAETTARFFTGAVGFLCYKLAVVGVHALPSKPSGAGKRLQADGSGK